MARGLFLCLALRLFTAFSKSFPYVESCRQLSKYLLQLHPWPICPSISLRGESYIIAGSEASSRLRLGWVPEWEQRAPPARIPRRPPLRKPRSGARTERYLSYPLHLHSRAPFPAYLHYATGSLPNPILSNMCATTSLPLECDPTLSAINLTNSLYSSSVRYLRRYRRNWM